MDPTKYIPREALDTPGVTTNSGAAVPDTLNSLSINPRGPVVLSDFHLLEKLANFDRERIPERVVHARGVSARGEFTCTQRCAYTTAAPFMHVGKKTPVAVRFSTVIHSRHSPETLRDPRGFAVKFYTEGGNWDLVGNNFPVFFIRDAMAFPDMVHAFKPSPVTENQEWHRILDFLAFHPESLHMLTFLLDDVGVPKDYTRMNGAGVHTYVMEDENAKQMYVKFHWISEQGEESLMDEEAERVCGKDFSHATHQLINSISQGRFPAWKLKIQVMDPATELDQPFGDPLDATKTWPESLFPMQDVGRLVLNRNMDNHFLETEQIAFSPGNVIPGINYSNDKLLQGRLFSYADTQRYRIGANYLQLPVNAPRCPFMNRQYDGALNFMQRSSEVNYLPSIAMKGSGHFQGMANGVKMNDVNHSANGVNGYSPHSSAPDAAKGSLTRSKIPVENNFTQAGERWRSFDKARQERFVRRVADTLNAPRVSKQLKLTWIQYWTNCDKALGARIGALVHNSAL